MIEKLTAVVSVLVVVSISAERLVELVKGLVPTLDTTRPTPDGERMRQWVLHLLSLIAGFVVVFLCHEYIAAALGFDQLGLVQGVGLAVLASGGSSLWNSVLTYMLSLKNIKRVQERDLTGVAQHAGSVAAAAASLPTAMPSPGPTLGRVG